jgi:hypothetical protein
MFPVQGMLASGRGSKEAVHHRDNQAKQLHSMQVDLPVEHNPLRNGGNGVLRIVERRELRPDSIIGEGHRCRSRIGGFKCSNAA